MRCKTLDELVGNEILARDILTEDFQTILPAGATLKLAYIDKLRELNIGKVFIKEILPTEKMDILKEEVGQVFVKVLEDAGVYKCTPEGRAAFRRFIQALKR